MAVLVITGLAFLPGIGGGFVWDDWSLIVHNEQAHHLGDLLGVWARPFWGPDHAEGNAGYGQVYRPVVSFAYVLQYLAFGADARGFHVVSWLLHITAVALAMALIRRRLPPAATGSAAALSAAAATVLFALHPTRAESVAWVSGQTDLWMAVWLLVGLIGAFGRGFASRSLCLAGFALAGLSKEVALLAPLPLLVDRWSRLGPDLPAVGMAALGSVAALALRFVFVPPDAGAVGFELAGLPQRVLASAGFYLRRTFWPEEPSVLSGRLAFDETGAVRFDATDMALGAVGLCLTAALFVLALRRPRARPWLSDLLWFWTPLVLVLGVVPLGSTVFAAERFLYFPMIGLSALVARALVRPLLASGPRRYMTVAVSALAAVALGIASAAHAIDFRSERTLWQSELARDPNSVIALERLSSLAQARGEPQLALRYLERAVRAAQDRNLPHLAARAAASALVLGLRLTPDSASGDLQAIHRAFERLAAGQPVRLRTTQVRLTLDVPAAALDDLRGNVASFQVPRAWAALRAGRRSEAIAHLETVVRAAPTHRPAWRLLVTAQARAGRRERALATLKRARERFPSDRTLEALERQLKPVSPTEPGHR